MQLRAIYLFQQHTLGVVPYAGTRSDLITCLPILSVYVYLLRFRNENVRFSVIVFYILSIAKDVLILQQCFFSVYTFRVVEIHSDFYLT